MSTNTEVALEVIRHFNTLDADGLRDLVTENIKHTAAGTQFDTDLEGREEYLDYIRILLSRFKKCDFQPYHVYDVADQNAVVVEWTADFITDTDIEWSSRGALIFDIVDGKVDWVRDYFDTEKTKSIYSA
jgi:ketosteroid isomerase-like protein